MARFKIDRPDGTPTPYFYSDKDGTEPSRKSVYKETEDGVKRMKGPLYDSKKKRMRKE